MKNDLINKQTVAKLLDGWLLCLNENCHKQSASDLKMIIKDFKNLPTVQLGTNLAEVGMNLATKRTVKGFPIDADLLMLIAEEKYGCRARDRLYEIIRNMPMYELPSVQSDDDRLERCRFEYVNACKILAHRTPDTRKKDIDDAYAVVRTLNPIFGEESF